jgi:hypothetical protein
LTLYLGSLSNSWVFVIPSLGNSGGACAEVTVSKTFDTSGGSPVLTSTKIISKGYNVGTDDGSSHCFSSDVNRIERVLEVDY